MNKTLVSLGLLFVTSALADDLALPAGWRAPSLEELGVVAVADFNGDKLPDRAIVVKNARSKGGGVLLWLSDEKAGYSWKVLHTHTSDVPYKSYVAVLAPGDYGVMCVFTNEGCTPKEKLRSGFASIYYCEHDQGTNCGMKAVFVWNNKTKSFIRGMYGD